MIAIDRTDAALELIRGMTLPDGRFLRDTLPADEWIEREVLRPILARDDDGAPLHRLAWIELARGSWKTGAIAAIAIAEAVSEFGTHVFAIATDLDQARLITEAIAGQCFRNPKLAAVFNQTKDEFTVKRNRSRIRVVASDAPGFYGVGVDTRRLRIICDEMGQWPRRDMLDAALSALPKVHDSQLVVITNAGLRGSWQAEARTAFESDGYLFAAPGTIASWIRPEDVARVKRTVPESVYRRYYENEWVEASGDFITRAMLNDCIDPQLRPRIVGEKGVTYCVGLDLGLTKDRTVRSIVHYDSEADQVVLDAMRVWQGTPTAPVSIEAVERDLIEVHGGFNAPTFRCDPWQLKGSIERLRTGGANTPRLSIDEFIFSASSVMHLSETLYNLIAAGRLRLYADADLECELVALQVKVSTMGWRIDHQRGGFSDRAIALGVAALLALDRHRRARWGAA